VINSKETKMLKKEFFTRALCVSIIVLKGMSKLYRIYFFENKNKLGQCPGQSEMFCKKYPYKITLQKLL